MDINAGSILANMCKGYLSKIGFHFIFIFFFTVAAIVKGNKIYDVCCGQVHVNIFINLKKGTQQ